MEARISPTLHFLHFRGRSILQFSNQFYKQKLHSLQKDFSADIDWLFQTGAKTENACLQFFKDFDWVIHQTQDDSHE